mgnify:CR=1 FL=1
MYVLGIDAGGSKTVCYLADSHGRIVGEGRGGGDRSATTVVERFGAEDVAQGAGSGFRRRVVDRGQAGSSAAVHAAAEVDQALRAVDERGEQIVAGVGPAVPRDVLKVGEQLPVGGPERLGGRVEVVLHDERFTTRMAERFGGEGDEDSRAAAHLLEGWLQAQP